MDPTLSTIDFRDFWLLAPAILLASWGLVVLLVDLALARKRRPAERRTLVGWLALLGVGLALVAEVGLMQAQQQGPGDQFASAGGWLSPSLSSYFANAQGTIFLG